MRYLYKLKCPKLYKMLILVPPNLLLLCSVIRSHLIQFWKVTFCITFIFTSDFADNTNCNSYFLLHHFKLLTEVFFFLHKHFHFRNNHPPLTVEQTKTHNYILIDEYFYFVMLHTSSLHSVEFIDLYFKYTIYHLMNYGAD